ncbi:MAG: HDIG domain-containing protein [Endomicrobium sp.]|jgi:putative nucleotidyltransferase with HDIG domain|nr:HDIG domain-containing protein [Endomicrobium sp.]
MNNFFKNVVLRLRNFILKVSKSVKPPECPVIKKESKCLFQKEIKIPVAVSITFTILVVYCILLLGAGVNLKMMFAVLIFLAAVIIFFISQIQNREKSVIDDTDAVVLMCLLFINALSVFQISKEYLSPFVSPVAAFSVMAAMLLSLRLGTVYAVCLSLCVAFLNNMRFDIFLTMFTGAVFVVADVKGINRKFDFVKIGIRTVIANSLLVFMFYLIGVYNILQFKYNIFYSVLNGIFSVSVLFVLVPLFEKIFSGITNIKLIELSDFNNPLLKKLMTDAPGTYHHSIITADIAEQAASAIGENPLMARVGSYYHDIGKLKNQLYFIENQLHIRNPHDDLNPEMSRIILNSHVKNGILFAKEHNINEEIIDIIRQHHGTTVMRTFYQRALELGLHVDSEHFRYSGPKPDTKISAVIMLSDSCEAACRSLEDPTEENIRNMVEKIVDNRFKDGQFSMCPITLKDLELIKDSIVSAIMGIYHARIEYK